MTTSILSAIRSAMDMARSYIAEYEEGIKDGTYGAWEATDLDKKKADLAMLESVFGDMDADKLPIVVVRMDAGTIVCTRSSIPVEVIILDEDTEGGDSSNIVKVNEQGVYVTSTIVTEVNSPVDADRVDPYYVQSVSVQVHERNCEA